MSDLQKRLGELDQLDTPDMRAAIEQRAARLRAEPTTPGPEMLPGVSTWRGTLIAIGTATAIVVMAVAAVWLGGRGTSDVADEPATPRPTTAPLATGVGDGQTVGVTVSGVSGHDGHELAGVLYAGELTDLDRDALGGFWWVVSDEDFTAVLRQPADMSVGRFPYVSDQALTVEPGTYTLVIWVDTGLSPATRWVPINTDGRGLYGCHAVFEVGGDTQTNIEITPNLHPDGWNINCTTP
ncbi:MAG: hypothetical protein OER12_05205 [Acidimicrobiia bacterium]|nr:hypothetical protein [Acidimicrobiia bacterium]